jgi:DNA (cytosine-5)-methyltransferase 1
MGPRLAILENVRGHLSLGFDSVLADLASVGWSARWGVVRASDAGACHQRARLFIVAYPDKSGLPDAADESRDTERRKRSDAGLRAFAASKDSDVAADADSSPRKQGVPRMGLSDPEGRSKSAADADVPGRQARGDTRHDSQRIWQQPVRLAAPTAYACHRQQQEHSRHDFVDGEWSEVGRGSVLTAWPGGDGVDSVGSLARPHAANGGTATSHLEVHWGDYGSAIARWERVIGRPAPAPTELGRTGNPRLAPRFVEWMMGLPDGWVTDPSIGISRNDQLKALGNGVVPQQAALALRHLLTA